MNPFPDMENNNSTIAEKEYDCVFSLGKDCGCTMLLRAAGLQERSYPLDWLIAPHNDFDIRILLLANNFKNFINKADFILLENKESTDTSRNVYKNNKTGLNFYHDFPKDISFEDAFDGVKEKYERRIKRFYEKMGGSKKVLFVWFDQYVTPTDQQITNAYVLLSRKFPEQEISFLIIGNGSSVKSIEKQEYTTGENDSVTFATKFTYNMCSDPESTDDRYRIYGVLGYLGTIFNEYGLSIKKDGDV